MGWIRDLWKSNCKDMGVALTTLKSFKDIRVYVAKNQIINGKRTSTLSEPVYFVWNGDQCISSSVDHRIVAMVYALEIKKEAEHGKQTESY